MASLLIFGWSGTVMHHSARGLIQREFFVWKDDGGESKIPVL